jgi:hypothetical protein
MAKVKGIALTEKGSLKPLVRDHLSEYVFKQIANLVPNVEVVADRKNVLCVSHTDLKGNNIYTTITITTGIKHPSEMADRKSRAKATVETIEFEE